MFRSTLTRLRAVLELADDLLGDPYDEPQPPTAQLHPHRRPLRWERARRPGRVPAPPAYCLSPVRSGRGRVATRDRVS